MSECFICDRIESIKKGTNPFLVTELPTSYIVIGDRQFFKGYSLVLSKYHVAELHDLTHEVRSQFLNEMALVAEAVCHAFKPDKLNYELLGNTDRHLHWHLFPRYKTDPNPKYPIWSENNFKRHSESPTVNPEELEELKQKLLTEIKKLQG